MNFFPGFERFLGFFAPFKAFSLFWSFVVRLNGVLLFEDVVLGIVCGATELPTETYPWDGLDIVDRLLR
jgi:hypothetical protein